MYSSIEEVYQFLQSRRTLGIKLGLDRMEKMLDLLDHPEKQIKAVHIAGTNGKGSTLTFIKEALIHNGYTVGTFTSPSIEGFKGHIHLNHEAISDQGLVVLMNELYPIMEKLDQAGDAPTEYEIVVILAILYFKEYADIALFETNMGGREDSTNCVLPLLTIITNIGLDHITYLGSTYQEIASHKAGIIKQNTPVILGNINEQAMSVIQAEANDKKAPILRFKNDFNATQQHVTERKSESFTFVHEKIQLSLVLNMKGLHQVDNAALACMALLKLTELGFPIEKKLIQTAFLEASNPGRFEKIYDKPIIIVDGAHNTEGVTTFLNTINRYYPNQKKRVLFAAYKDKPFQEMIMLLENQVDKLVFTSFDHPRAEYGETLVAYSSGTNSYVENRWQSYIKDFIKDSKTEEVLFITGSLHFIGLVRTFIAEF